MPSPSRWPGGPNTEVGLWGVKTVNEGGGPALAQCWVATGGGAERVSKLDSPKKMESSLIAPRLRFARKTGDTKF